MQGRVRVGVYIKTSNLLLYKIKNNTEFRFVTCNVLHLILCANTCFPPTDLAILNSTDKPSYAQPQRLHLSHVLQRLTRYAHLSLRFNSTITIEFF